MPSQYQMPDHFASYSEKQKPEWYKAAFEYYFNVAVTARDKDNLDTLKDLFEGNLDKRDYNYILNPYNFREERFKNLPGAIRNYDIVSPVWRRFMGEYSQAPNQFQVVASNPYSENRMLVERNQLINSQLRQMAVNALNKQGIDTGMDTKEVPNLKERVDGFISTWRDKRANIDQEILDVIRYLTKDEIFRYRTLSDWINYGECYSYREVRTDDIYKEYVSVQEYYPIDNGEEFVEDHDAGIRVRRMSLFQILDKLQDRISNSQKKDIEELIRIYNDHGNSVDADLITNLNNIETRSSNPLEKGSTIRFCDEQGFVDLVHLVFKTYKKIGILTYENALGELVESEVSADYKLDPLNGDINIEYIQVPVVMDMYRIGEESVDIYIKPEELLVQRQDLNNKHICKLPYNGKVRLFPGFPNHSILEILLPYQIFINIVYLVRERAIAKNHGKIGVFPKGLLGSDDLKIEEQMYFMLADGKIYIDETYTNFATAVQALKAVDLSDYQFIQSLTDLIAETKQSAYEDVDMNRQRLGETQASDGKYTTQQALFRSALGSALTIEIYNKFLEVDYMADLDYSKVAFIDGKKGEYLTSDKHVAFFEIEGVTHSETNYGVFCKHNQEEQTRLEELKALAFSAGQNGQITLAAEAVNAKSASKLRDIIARYEEVMKNREERMAKNQQESDMAIAKQERESEEADRQADIMIAKYNNDVKFKIAELQLLQKQLEIASKDRAVDIQKEIEEKRLEIQRYIDDNKKVIDTAVNRIQTPVI